MPKGQLWAKDLAKRCLNPLLGLLLVMSVCVSVCHTRRDSFPKAGSTKLVTVTPAEKHTVPLSSWENCVCVCVVDTAPTWSPPGSFLITVYSPHMSCCLQAMCLYVVSQRMDQSVFGIRDNMER